MHVSLLLEMAGQALADRTAVSGTHDLTYAELSRRAAVAATRLREDGIERLVFVGSNSAAFPVAVFAAAWAAIPLVSLNYRLDVEQLRGLIAQQPRALVLADAEGIADIGSYVDVNRWLASTDSHEEEAISVPDLDPEGIAALIYTSGTTAAPKAAILRHRHLASYVLGTVELASATEAEAALVSVPPYHVAGIANVLTNVYAGRRIVYLNRFSPEAWLETVRTEGVTNAMVVPTMLARIVQHLDAVGPAETPTLRTISYGGAKTPLPVLERALALFPQVNFVNAYGLTETSSSIAVLGPEDHRAAFESDDPAVRARLASAGQVMPNILIEIRDESGASLPSGEVGEIWVSGPQVSGEYLNAAGLEGDGWFHTRDRGHLDADNYLFVEGRADDTIIRGGENIAPAEIEDVVMRHPDVLDVAVVGVPDEEWGQRLVAVVVPVAGVEINTAEMRGWLKERLRSSRTPDEVAVVRELPRTDTGKILRRTVVADLVDAHA